MVESGFRCDGRQYKAISRCLSKYFVRVARFFGGSGSGNMTPCGTMNAKRRHTSTHTHVQQQRKAAFRGRASFSLRAAARREMRDAGRARPLPHLTWLDLTRRQLDSLVRHVFSCQNLCVALLFASLFVCSFVCWQKCVFVQHCFCCSYVYMQLCVIFVLVILLS